MSAYDQAAAAAIAQIALAADGALLGLTLAFVAVRSIFKFRATRSALHIIEEAPLVRVSDLRSLLGADKDLNQFDGGRVVIVRGTVEAKSSVEGNWKSLVTNVLVAPDSGEKAVILQRTHTCIYNDWKVFMGWNSDLLSLFSSSRRVHKSSSIRKVPFVIVEAGRWPQSEYVNVKLDGSMHPLPLVTVYHHLHPVNATPLTFLQALFGHQYPVGLLDEEKILPLGKEITAVGVCSSSSGTLEIKACNYLPFFISDMTKDQMLVDLAFKTKILLWSGIVFSSVAIGILSYAAVRNWNRWKVWRQQRQSRSQQQNIDSDPQLAGDEETDDVPDGQLCVICLTRRRLSVFVPCGHLACCQQCALLVVRESSPKCPVCRQAITNAVRMYDS
ncbi:unnamed protein product [Cuscuta campestris]|uniref:RING-type E3 ubiquitin transferase n=1 Tax=Cuscuta campestris TaxID=132261 RepID=A0A484N6W2_9ASTE|nr:unnamed protein product [Cuscuta campestris]